MSEKRLAAQDGAKLQKIDLIFKKEVAGHALVNEEDYKVLSKYSWHLMITNNIQYAIRWEGRKTILMHRQILDVISTSVKIDHIDRNGLNNSRSNLRICSHAENKQNVGVRSDSKSGIRGVRLRPWGKWDARVKLNGIEHYLGVYKTKEEAACVVRKWRKENMEFANE